MTTKNTITTKNTTTKKRNYNSTRPSAVNGTPVTIRVDKEMYAWLSKNAEKNRRSRSAEILHLLDLAKEGDK